MEKMRKIIILSILGIAIITTFMLKNDTEIKKEVATTGELPILLDLSSEA